MSTLLQRLAQWARDLSPSDLPPAVVERARLQHLSMAGAVRAVRGTPAAQALARAAGEGEAALVTGGRGSERGAVRLHAGLASWLEYDDALFLGASGGGGVAGAWAAAGQHDLDELLCATVIANELGGRLGASLLLGPGNDRTLAAVQSFAAAAAVGRLAGLDASTLAHALALSLASPPLISWGALFAGGAARASLSALPAAAGAEAVALAAAGVRGSLDLLDAADGLLTSLCWVPLRNAFTGLGQAWLTETLFYKLTPASVYTVVPVQAVAEILRRHVKAADKRLRSDQLDRIDVKVSAPAWYLEQLGARRPGLDAALLPLSIRRAVGALVIAYEYGPAQLDPDWLDANRDAISEVARRVEVQHDWERSLCLAEHLVDVAAPLLAGLTAGELRQVGHLAKRSLGEGLPRPAAADLLSLMRHRPDRLLETIRLSPGDLGQARLREWQYLYSAEVRLHTTRGGTWPEDRTIPEGSPGWPWDRTVASVKAKYAGGDEAAQARGGSLLQAAGSSEARGWVASLLQG